MLRFKPGFSLSSFAFIKRLFSSSSLSAVRVVSSTYLKLLVFPLAVLIPAYDSSSLAFHIMYSAYNLNKQGTIYSLEVLLSQLEPACSSMSGSCYCFFLHTGFSRGRSGGLVFPSLKSFSQFLVIHTVKGFGIVNKAEVDVFLELSCFFDNPADIGNLISGSSAFSKTSLNIREFTVHELLKPGLENFEHYFTSM